MTYFPDMWCLDTDNPYKESETIQAEEQEQQEV